MRILAVDPSLSATGMAVLTVSGGFPLWQVGQIKTKPAAGYPLTRKRLIGITAEVGAWLGSRSAAADLILIERPALSRQSGMAHDRAGLWWFLYDMLMDNWPSTVVLTPEPNLRAKYVTGRGNAGKDEVMAGVIRRYTEAMTTDNNTADAVAMCAMGARLLGAPIEASLPAKNAEALRTLSLTPR